MPCSRALAALALLLFASTGADAQQPGASIYNIFVQKCRESGGTPGSTLDQYNRGELFVCNKAGSGRSTGSADDCREARTNADWVLTDRGARGTYARHRATGMPPFEAVLEAQAHNRRAQETLRKCRPTIEAYLKTRTDMPATKEPELSRRALGQGDCACISVVPAGGSRPRGYRITNKCDLMKVAVNFAGDITLVSPRFGLSSWGQPQLAGGGREPMVYAPDWKIVSIKAVGISNAASNHTCNF